MPPSPTQRQRDHVVRRLTDLLFAASLSRHEKALIDEMLARLVTQQETEARLKFARRLADLSDLPLRVARVLATDELAIAKLVLERVDVFDDGDLIHIVKLTGTGHHQVIAGRQPLSASVSELLIACGPESLVAAVLRNRTAALSARSFRYLCDLAVSDAELQALLLARDDLPAEIAHQLFWSVPHASRVFILQRFSLERRGFADALQDVASLAETPDEDVEWALRLSGAFRRQPRNDAAFLPLLLRWLENQEDETVSVPLAALLAIDARTLARLGADRGGEPLIVMLKALGLTGQQFKTLTPRIAAALDLQEGPALSGLCALFDMLSTGWSDLVLRLWDHDRPKSLDGLSLSLRADAA